MMPQGTFLHTVIRTVRNEDYHFHVYTDARMIHVRGRGGDQESTGKPHDNASGDFILNDMINALLARGNISPGAWPAD